MGGVCLQIPNPASLREIKTGPADATERVPSLVLEFLPLPLSALTSTVGGVYGIIRGVKGRLRSGQAALEYVLALASLLVVVGLLAGLVGAATRHAARTTSLVSGDCP